MYRRNLARFARDVDHFNQELRLSVLDELAVFVGLDNDARQRLGLPPMPEITPEPEPEPEEGKGKRKPKRARKRRARAAK